MNSNLYGNYYRIPTPIIMRLNAWVMKNPNSDNKRPKNLLKGGMVSYSELKRLKHDLENYDPATGDDAKYEASGGNEMLSWVNSILGSERSSTDISKKTNSSIETASDTENLKASNGIVDIHETDEKEKNIESLIKNALAVIFNPEKRFLLLKRSSFPDQWMPNKWGLVGGGVEKGEDPMDACKREIKEETGLVINALIERCVMQRKVDSVEHIFVGKYDGDPFNIKLDDENQGYGWFGIKEIGFLDTVPNLMDYINITLKEYE